MYVYTGTFQYLFNALVNSGAFVTFFAQNIDHDGIAEAGGIPKRLVKYRSQVLLELRYYVTLDRLMAAVMRAWRQLIYQYLAVLVQEHFDCQQAPNIQ